MTPQVYPPYDNVDPMVMEAVIALLARLGYDVTTEHTDMTAYRLGWYLMNAVDNSGRQGEGIHLTTFANKDPRITDMQVVPDIPIWSVCSHHLLPFFGKADFGYIPGELIIGLSKVPLIIQKVARGPWLQEHLTSTLADLFMNRLGATGVIIRTRCTHTCVMLDMDTSDVPVMITSALRGVYMHNPNAKQEFLHLVDNARRA